MRNFSSIIFLVTISGILPVVFGQHWRVHTIDDNLPGAATVDIGDIDGDNNMDIAATSFSTGKVVWYENDLPNQIQGPHTIDDNLPGASGVQVADIDNDTKMDVVAAGYRACEVVWYKKKEVGTSIEWIKSIISDNVNSAQVVRVADVDNDEDADVVVTAIDADHIIWFENNNLSWTKRIIGDLDGAVCLELHDMDGDLDLDIVATSFLEFKVFWFENNLTNHNWPRHTIDISFPGAWGVGVADMDSDSDPDVVATSLICDDVVWYENNLPDLPWEKHIIDENLDGARYLSIVDMDMDEDLDLVVTGYESDLIVTYENDLFRTSWLKNTIDTNLNGANCVSTTDLNGDTYPDLIVTGWYANNIIWYENIIADIDLPSNKVPTSYMLSQNYPNPFNPTTDIEFSIPKSEFVTLKVCNTLGEEVSTLVSEKLAAGKYKYGWDASSLASGVYLYRIQAGDYMEAKRMVLMK
jgi:hypothetical protein